MVSKEFLTALALGSMILSAPGCSEYLERRDTLTLGSGDAVQRNIALQVIDPSPALARQPELYTDGSRTQRALERYRNPPMNNADATSIGGAQAPVVSSGTASTGSNISRF